MRRGRGFGYALLVVAWTLLLLPPLALAAYLLVPPAWLAAVGLPPPGKPSPRLVIRLAALADGSQLGGDESAAWRRYRIAAPPASSTPMIAVVLSGLGRSDAVTTAALALPGAVTLSFTPYGRPFEPPLAEVRAGGHELLLELPMESATLGALELGPQGLLTALPAAELSARLAWLLEGPPPGVEEPAVGASVFGGDRFLADAAGLEPVVEMLGLRGLVLLLPAPAGPGLAALAARHGLSLLVADRQLAAGEPELARQLAELERIALVEGEAVALARASPTTIARLAAWAAGLPARGFTLVPLSAVLDRRLAGQ